MIGYIYKLFSDENDMFYIGSTTETLHKRFIRHKSDSKKRSNTKVYKYISENGGWDKWKINLLEEYECEDKYKLWLKEEEYRLSYDKILLLNSQICYSGLTKQEYDKERDKNMKYFIKINNKKRHDANKEVENERSRKYKENNKEAINKQRKEYRKRTTICTFCCSIIKKNNIGAHQRTEKCKNIQEVYNFIYS